MTSRVFDITVLGNDILPNFYQANNWTIDDNTKK